MIRTWQLAAFGVTSHKPVFVGQDVAQHSLDGLACEVMTLKGLTM